MDIKKDNFSTILIIAVLSVGIFYLLRPSSSKFTNVNKNTTNTNNTNNTNTTKKNINTNNLNKKNIKEHIANVNDPSILTPNPKANDVPANPGSVAEPPSAIPASVVDSANANKQFPTGQFKPLLLTPSNEVTPSTTDTSAANIGTDYTLGVDQTLANPSGRQMQGSNELRPQEMNSGWFNSPYDRDSQLSIENGNLLASATGQAKIGIDTIGQSLRNASYDIRGSVPIVKFDIGPFNNSTIEYDYNIKALY
jgi:hypothetical protein